MSLTLLEPLVVCFKQYALVKRMWYCIYCKTNQTYQLLSCETGYAFLSPDICATEITWWPWYCRCCWLWRSIVQMCEMGTTWIIWIILHSVRCPFRSTCIQSCSNMKQQEMIDPKSCSDPWKRELSRYQLRRHCSRSQSGSLCQLATPPVKTKLASWIDLVFGGLFVLLLVVGYLFHRGDKKSSKSPFAIHC